MKIKLKEGKQKELIFLAKNNLTWNNLSKKINVNQIYLSNDLKNERVLISGETYYKLCKIACKNFDEFILEKLNNHWGQIKGGRNSPGALKKIKIPLKNKYLAELIGIILGDGNINYYKKGKKIGVYQVNIAGHKDLDKEYHLNYVAMLFKKLFDVKAVEVLSKRNNGRYLIISSKKLVDFLISNELKSGDKIKNQVTIPSWIKENNFFLKACIRGLFDTDGSVYKLTNQNSHQICFTNYNNHLLTDVRNSLLFLGIKVSKITKGRDIIITKKTELKKFLKQIGFRNPKHLNKIQNWNL